MQQNSTEKDEHVESDSDDNTDVDLLAAAANWADAPVKEKKTAQRTQPERIVHEAVKRKADEPTYSLHVTQLSYEASDYDIRDMFISKGCLVTSVRLVDKPDEKTGIRKFTGVAFVDVADKASFANGLKLHRSTHLGRRINVRPTRTKEELSRIVEVTKKRVSEIIHSSTTSSRGGEQQPSTTSRERASTNKPKDANASSPQQRRADNKGKKKKSKESPAKAVGKGSTKRKLTKQERNRRAAMILMKKGKQKTK